MQLSKTLKILMAEAKITEYELARRVGIPQPMINKILNNKNQNPKLATLKPLADYFMVSISQLIGEQPLSVDRQDFRFIEQHKGIKTIPLLNWDNLDSFVLQQKRDFVLQIASNFNSSNSGFGVKLADNSMYPKFAKDSVIIVEPEQAAKDEDFILVYLQNKKQFLLRQYQFVADTWLLKAINPEKTEKNLPFSAEDRCIGVVVEARNFF